MALTCHMYTKFGLALLGKTVNVNTDALQVLLLSAYVPGQDTHQYVADVLAGGVGTEVSTSGTGYARQTLTAVTTSTTGHVTTLTCANPMWTGAFSATHAVFYDSTPGSDAANPLIGYWDFGVVESPTITFTLQIGVGGLLTLTGA